MAEKTESTTAFRIRLSKTDVTALKAIARQEGVRRGSDTSWCDLVRESIQKLVRQYKPLA